MKCISVFILCAAAVSAADFTNGQAARLVIGQTTFTSEDPNSSDTVVGGISGVAYAADTLFVADSNQVGAAPSNNRVLLFGGLSSQLPTPTAELPYNRKCPVCVGQATVVLGQPDFTTTTENLTATQSNLRQPTAVASDGVHLVVADTGNNRVLIWNRIPTMNEQPADVVVGEPNFTTSSLPSGNTPNSKSMRGPQGVWIQNGKLYVADTQNNRVLVYNQIPTANGVAADVVLGEPNFNTAVQPNLAAQTTSATASNMLNPVAVSSDGTHLFVTDLGYNRVLIWNSIPTTNGAPADVEVGQPDMVSSVANNSYTGTAATSTTDTTDKETPVMCTVSNGIDGYGNPTYPEFCSYTVSFPRDAMAVDGRLFIADGGNDRLMVFKQIPTANAQPADYVIGQLGGTVTQAPDSTDSLQTPMSMAWDGTNLYVADTYNTRIMVYSMGANSVPYQGVVNAASLAIYANGNVTISGSIQAGDTVTINIGGTASTDSAGNPTALGGANYVYTVKSTDSFTDTVNGVVVNDVLQGLYTAITSANNGAGDPNVTVAVYTTGNQLLFTSRTSGPNGDNITYFAFAAPSSANSAAKIASSTAGATLSGGGDAASVAAGTIVSITGANLSAGSAAADTTQTELPDQLAGTQVYFNGILAPLFSVTPTQITAQVPWEVSDTTSVNAFVRSVQSDGSVVVTTPVAVTIVPQNPGIYSHSGEPDPVLPSATVGLVYHGSNAANGVISVDGTAVAGDTATVTIEERSYNYTVQGGDTLDNIRDALVYLINQDPKVTAVAAGLFDRILVTARIQGPEGDNIPIGASAQTGASVIMTAISTSLCCANVAGSLVTPQNPALAGEVLYVYATGLGPPIVTNATEGLIQTGYQYPPGSPNTVPVNFVSSLAGGDTADVLSASLLPGSVGIFQVFLHLNSSLPTNADTTLTIAQDVYVSNAVTFPMSGNPASGN
jgi:uncharacterized protein (TIGR03437 family)